MLADDNKTIKVSGDTQALYEDTHTYQYRLLDWSVIVTMPMKTNQVGTQNLTMFFKFFTL